MSSNIVSRRVGHSVMRKIIVFMEVVTLAAASVGTWAAAKYNKMEVSDINLDNVTVNKEVENKYTGYTNIALFGLDARDDSLGEGNRSDTIIICSINNDTSKIKLASVYRDTYLSMNLSNNQISSSNYYKFDKANAAYSYGGPEQALSMLNTNLDLNITNYVATNWDAMITAIDAVGGLDLNMTSEEVYWMNGYQLETAESCGKEADVHDLELMDGVQHCNGVQATAFCRIRYTEGDDYKRTERQRYVIEEMFKKAKNLKFSQISEIADKVFPKIKTNIKISKALSIAKRLSKFEFGETYGFPYDKSTGDVSGSGSCVFCNDLEQDVKKLHEDLFGEKNYNVSSKVKEIATHINYGATDAEDISVSGGSLEQEYTDNYSTETNNYNYNNSYNNYNQENQSTTGGDSYNQDTGGGTTPGGDSSDTGGNTPIPEGGDGGNSTDSGSIY